MQIITLIASAVLLLGPPPTPVETVVDVMHGERVADDYRWLEPLEADSDRVRDWTTAQNDYTRSILDGLPGREALERRLTDLMTIGRVGAPEVRGDLHFYTERSGTQNQPVLYLRHGHDGTRRELLDPNTLDEHGLYALDWFDPSPDGQTVAFGLSYAGDEMTVLQMLDVATGEWLADTLTGKIEFAGWAPNSRAFLYGMLEDPADAYSRSFRWHEVGTHHRHDPMLVLQDDPSRIPDARLSEDGRWITVQIFEGWSKQDIYVVDAHEWHRTGEANLAPVAVGNDARFEPEFVKGDTLFLLTTLDAPNAMLFGVDLTNPSKNGWRVLIPQRDDAVLRSVSEARGQVVAEYQRDATTRLERFRLSGEPLGAVDLPGIGTATIATEPDRPEAYIAYESFNEPRSLYRVNLNTGVRSLWARPEVPVDPALVEVRQEWCTSADGTRVPMFIVHRTGVVLDGANPTMVYGYGGFNVSLTPRFSATNFPWLENGGIYVTVTLRGGGEFGEAWHQSGMLANKQNVFDDLYAATEHLFERGYTSAEHCAVLGGSNGGLLTGVAATQRPDLYAAVISAVPLLDMLRYQNLLMAKFWIPEYGDPENAEHFRWLRAYSPYHNIKAGQTYPAIMITAGENDNRVHPMHARKMVAALQSRAANDPDVDPIMLWVDREGGHGQGKPMRLRVRDLADRWSFTMWQTGMSTIE